MGFPRKASTKKKHKREAQIQYVCVEIICNLYQRKFPVLKIEKYTTQLHCALHIFHENMQQY
jgi:hypothetical protein